MPKIQTINFHDFMSGDYRKESTFDKVVVHVKKHKVIYSIAGYTLIITLGGPHLGFAAGSLDHDATKIYHQLCEIGKWIIIGKGGWETINAAIKSDFESAKKNFISYLLIYVILLALPFGMDKVDSVFHDMGGK